MNPYKKILFPVTVFHTNIRENNMLKQKYLPLMSECYNSGKLKPPEGWITNNVQTSFNHDEFNQEIFDQEIVEVYQKYIERFFDDVVKFDFVDLWFNWYEKGEYQEAHNHLNPDIFDSTVAHFAVIHYLRFDPEVHEAATFVDPIVNQRYNTFEMRSTHYSPKYCPKVDEGDIIMFPNYLEHYVKQTSPTENNPRVTVSFNISVKKYGKLERY